MIKKKQAIQVMQEFVNGQIDANQFWDIYINNKEIKNLLIKDMREIDKIAYFNPLTIENLFNINDLYDRYELFEMIRRYLYRNNIPYIDNNKESKLIHFIQDCQPSWLDIRNEKFWENILSGIDITKANNKKLIKEKILSMFEYEKQPPVWLQSPEWPFNGNLQPLKFLEQKKINDNCIQYLFLEKNTNEIITIEQYD